MNQDKNNNSVNPELGNGTKPSIDLRQIIQVQNQL